MFDSTTNNYKIDISVCSSLMYSLPIYNIISAVIVTILQIVTSNALTINTCVCVTVRN